MAQVDDDGEGDDTTAQELEVLFLTDSIPFFDVDSDACGGVVAARKSLLASGLLVLLTPLIEGVARCLTCGSHFVPQLLVAALAAVSAILCFVASRAWESAADYFGDAVGL